MDIEKLNELYRNCTIDQQVYEKFTSKCWLSQYVLMYLEDSSLGKHFALLALGQGLSLGVVSEKELNELVTNLGLGE